MVRCQEKQNCKIGKADESWQGWISIEFLQVLAVRIMSSEAIKSCVHDLNTGPPIWPSLMAASAPAPHPVRSEPSTCMYF